MRRSYHKNVRSMTIGELFSQLKRVEIDENGCWIWKGALGTSGYGIATLRRKAKVAHKFFYEALIGPVEKGHHLDHTCEVRVCCNPKHVVPRTPLEHVRRHAAAQTHCKQGHEYTEENTYWRKSPSGFPARACKQCRRESSLRSYHQHRRVQNGYVVDGRYRSAA